MFGKVPKTLLSAAESVWGLATAARAETAIEMNILRTATKSKGDYGLGEVTATQAERIGRSWVGDGAKVASDGKTMVSADGLRQYRPATPKDSPYATTGVQANLQSRNVASGGWQSNGHLNILGK